MILDKQKSLVQDRGVEVSTNYANLEKSVCASVGWI
jgi:hypothetical protein